ncbi:MAG: hypothetical protein M1818_004732 [Claussenomyces sp. TS43310]|nr:MAG: hypothetical protein M1818_004732 [Claussenomyces sp. TS43310]
MSDVSPEVNAVTPKPPDSTEDWQEGIVSPTNPRLDFSPEDQVSSPSNEGQSRPSRPSRPGSVSFVPSSREPKISWGEPKLQKDRVRRSSPPAATLALTVSPASRFQHHVSFDNFADGEPTDNNTIALTLNVKHTGYQYRKRSRTFMVGIDENDYSNYALKWMLDELVDDGDEIVCVRVVDKDAKISNDKSMGRKEYQDEANTLMHSIQAKNEEHRAISIVLEFAVGKLHTTFQKMASTRGRSLGGFQGLMANRNSFSKWCLQYSPIPVVVVRPDEKREKKKLKRAADPTRNNYRQILQDSGKVTHEADTGPGASSTDINTLPANAPDLEAHAVAAALGLPARFDPTLKPVNVDGNQMLRKVQPSISDVIGTPRDSGSPVSRPSSPGISSKVIPNLLLESPTISDEGEDDSEDDEEGEFEAVPGHELLTEIPEARERKEKLRRMEVGEAAALAGRKGSIGSVDSTVSASTTTKEDL